MHMLASTQFAAGILHQISYTLYSGVVIWLTWCPNSDTSQKDDSLPGSEQMVPTVRRMGSRPHLRLHLQ